MYTGPRTQNLKPTGHNPTHMGIVTLKCTHCGGDVQLDDSREYGFCMYCGTKILIQQDVNNINVNVSYSEQTRTMKNSMAAQYKAARYDSALELADQIISLNSADPEVWFCAADCLIRVKGVPGILEEESMERLSRYAKQYALLANIAPVDPVVMTGNIFGKELTDHVHSMIRKAVEDNDTYTFDTFSEIMDRIDPDDPDVAWGALALGMFDANFSDDELRAELAKVSGDPKWRSRLYSDLVRQSSRVRYGDIPRGWMRAYDLGLRDVGTATYLLWAAEYNYKGMTRDEHETFKKVAAKASSPYNKGYYDGKAVIPCAHIDPDSEIRAVDRFFIEWNPVHLKSLLGKAKMEGDAVVTVTDLGTGRRVYEGVFPSDLSELEFSMRIVYPTPLKFDVSYGGRTFTDSRMVFARQYVFNKSGSDTFEVPRLILTYNPKDGRMDFRHEGEGMFIIGS